MEHNPNGFSFQVLRYSALAFGVFYGFSHQRTINAANRAAAEKHEYEHKQQLIEKAKEEFARKKNPASASTTGGREYTSFDMILLSSLGQRYELGAIPGIWSTAADGRTSQPRPHGPEIRPGGLLQRSCEGEPLELVIRAVEWESGSGCGRMGWREGKWVKNTHGTEDICMWAKASPCDDIIERWVAWPKNKSSPTLFTSQRTRGIRPFFYRPRYLPETVQLYNIELDGISRQPSGC